MYVIETRNVNTALHSALFYLNGYGIEEESRNGSVLVAPEPVTTKYENPQERVLFSPLRDANPFFHLMEALWMLAGRNDVAFPAYFNNNFNSFSDDGKTVHGAYGFRWRYWFNADQLEWIIAELRATPTSRRCVLAMWDACNNNHVYGEHNNDPFMASIGGKDVPCNTHVYVDARGNRLNITVCCRSNDIWWGCYGANAVHFSMLQEYLAGRLDLPIGTYWQVSNNFHLYTNVVPTDRLHPLMRDASLHNFYNPPQPHLFAGNSQLETCSLIVPMFMYGGDWSVQAINDFINKGVPHNQFLEGVALPMRRAFEWRKKHKEASTKFDAIDFLTSTMQPCDWRSAAINWIRRRENKQEGQ